jgi:hypothetical protein
MKNVELLEKIDAAIAEKNLSKHPFYHDWRTGKLSREALQLYASVLPPRRSVSETSSCARGSHRGFHPRHCS